MILIDYLVVAFYFSILIFIGFYFKKRASKSIESYFLADKSLPWWALGASGMASSMDVSGTMLITAMVYVIGMQALYMGISSEAVLLLAFLMVLTGKWTRRSHAMTTAEWMQFRFGNDQQGQWARKLSAVAQITFSVWAITYFIKGAGLFLSEILQLEAVIPTLFRQYFDSTVNIDGQGQIIAALFMVAIALIYTLLSGFYGVVYTQVFQACIILFMVIYVVILVMTGDFGLTANFNVSVPAGGERHIITHNQNILQWMQVLPHNDMNLPGTYSVYNMLSFISIFLFFRTTIEGMSGGGGYIAQRFYAAKNEKEAGLMAAFWIFLLSFRWLFAVAVALLAIKLGLENHLTINPEQVLPLVLMNYFPAGMKGLFLIGLLAAAMSTFVTWVNAGASYWVNDFVKPLMEKEGKVINEQKLLTHSRMASLILVALGILFTFTFNSLNQVWSFLTMGLGWGLIIPNLMRWYWNRFTGYGFLAGTFTGFLSATASQFLLPILEISINPYVQFFTICGLVLVACIVVSLMTQAPNEEVLDHFYQKTRPLGLWKNQLTKLNPKSQMATQAENRRDLLATFIAIPWQFTLFMSMMVFVTQQWHIFIPIFALFSGLTIALYFVWFRHLKSE